MRSQPAAYIEPFSTSRYQKTRDVQLHNCFLLRLDWTKAARWEVLKDQRNALDALKGVIKTVAIHGETETLGDLEAQRIQLDHQGERERAALASFQVLPQSRQIEQEANQLTAESMRS